MKPLDPAGRVRDIEALMELLATLSDDKPRVIVLYSLLASERRRDAFVY